MVNRKSLALALSSTLLFTACATTPMGPTVQVMPNPNKPFPIFQQDQEQCKQYAQSQVAGQADNANKAAAGQAALGVLLGGALGAAAGNHQGAGVGAATGAIAGTTAGAGSSQTAQLSIQDQYNTAFMQCMYSRGNQVPGALMAQAAPPPAAPASMPPAGMAPPPPPPTQLASNQGMTVAQAQARLNVLGYANGRADGAMGPKTHSALKLFQKDRGLPETGELDAGTAAELVK
jgi:hypothetical protein